MVLFVFVGSSVRSRRIFGCCSIQGGGNIWIGCRECGEHGLPNVNSSCRMGLGKAVEVSEKDGKTESKKVRWGNCDTDVRKLEVKICLRYVRGGSAASAHRLKPGLVRKAPRASLSDVFCTVFKMAKVDLFARL